MCLFGLQFHWTWHLFLSAWLVTAKLVATWCTLHALVPWIIQFWLNIHYLYQFLHVRSNGVYLFYYGSYHFKKFYEIKITYTSLTFKNKKWNYFKQSQLCTLLAFFPFLIRAHLMSLLKKKRIHNCRTGTNKNTCIF